MNIQSANINELTEKAGAVEGLLKALANRHRLMILCELHRGEASVSALQARVGLAQSALSQHLARLREDGLVATRREAQSIHYRIESPEVLRLMALLYELFCAPKAASEPIPAKRKETTS